MSPRLHKKYLSVNLYKDGKIKFHAIHRLVLMAYNPVEGMESLDVNHLDEIPTNNCLNNLCWMTRKENINYGSHNQKNGDAHGKAVICEELNITYKSMAEAAR